MEDVDSEQTNSVFPEHPEKSNTPEQKVPQENIGHTVTLTVTVALACTKSNDEQSKLLEELVKRNKRTVEAPKALQFFHCEYSIAPEHEATAADIVTYGVAAKVFTENDSKVVKTWDDGPLTWVAWVHSHEVPVTEDNVLDLYGHTLDFKLWDSKDKVSSKARFDRPKAFRLPSSKDIPGKGVAAVVAKQSRSWNNLQPQNSNHEKETTVNTEVKEKTVVPSNVPNNNTRVRSSLGRLAGYNMSEQEKKRISELKQQQSRLMKQLSLNGKPNKSDETSKKENIDSSSATQGKKTASENAKSRFASVKIKMESLFSGIKEITSRLSDPSVNVRDMYVSVTVGGNLLPKDLEKKLNPMVITIKSVKDLPSTPISQERLSSMCQPVYCSYQFLGNPVHTTASIPHSKDIHFDDMHVVLTGQIDQGNLFEFLHYNSFNIEIHDRDRKLPDTAKPPVIFGDDKDDKLIANVGMSTSRNTTHNAFSDRHRVFDPYGVAKLFLKELLHGQNVLHLLIAVNPCRTPDLVNNPHSKEKETRLVGVTGAIDRPENPPLPAGDYLNFGTFLKVKITLKYPLSCSAMLSPDCSMLKDKCPFGRLIYHFNYENKKLLQKLESFVKAVNSKALNLDHFQPHVMDVALSTYKLSLEQKCSSTLNVITGFHVMDGENHILVLEGLKSGAILMLQRDIGCDTVENGGFVRMLCDSSISFTSRLYADLDVNLCTVRLHQPLKKIIQQPLLYVRDLVPHQCFQCLVMIEQITWMNRLRDVCHNDLFPNHDMVISMSREFGVPLTYGDYEEHHKPGKDDELEEPIQVDQSNMKLSDHSRWTPIDHKNIEYNRYLKERTENKKMMPDYVLTNIVAVQDAGKRKRPKKFMVECDILGPPHNYSTQTLNSTELSKRTLRKMLSEDYPKSRFAYNPYYNSAVLAPIDEDEFYNQLENDAQQYWRTENGFVFPGVKSSLLSNVHPLRPDSSRIAELKLKWKENTLHAHKLSPTLKRDTWRWESRHQDLDLYRKPAKKVQHSPLSIHLPGDKRLDEKTVFYKKLQQEWKSKLVVASPRMKFHRVLCNTEQTNKSNQIDKLQGILKDRPQKASLKIHPALEIPPLSVVAYPSVDTSARRKGERIPVDSSQEKLPHIALQPGPYENSGWNIDKNTIPIWDPQHKLFAQLKGNDFTTYVREREYLWRGAKPTKEETFYEPVMRSPKAKLRDKSWIYEQPDEEADHRKSVYREEYHASEDVQRCMPIFPRHQLHDLSHVLENAPFTSDASVQLVQDVKEDKNNELKAHEPALYQSTKDDVEFIGNSGIKSSSRLAQVTG